MIVTGQLCLLVCLQHAKSIFALPGQNVKLAWSIWRYIQTVLFPRWSVC